MANAATRLTGNAIILLLLWICGCESASHVRLTSVRCRSYDANISQFEYCHLKAVNRNTREISLKLKIYDKPVNEVNITMQFLKKSNGYRQFMPDLNLDACLYLKKHNNFILNALYKVWSTYSNMNHTCPYDHDLIVSRLQVLDDVALEWIPFPLGDYAIFSTWFGNKVRRFQFDIYFSFIGS